MKARRSSQARLFFLDERRLRKCYVLPLGCEDLRRKGRHAMLVLEFAGEKKAARETIKAMETSALPSRISQHAKVWSIMEFIGTTVRES